MPTAPFHNDVAEGPDGAEARWLTTEDGVRLRAVAWRGGEGGTVLIFSGRTEYVEKYGRAAAEFRERGFAAASLDWRGQGLSDRALTDALTGHVADFLDYQRDVTAFMRFVEALDLPRPLFLVAHSMGGAIGLRALHFGLTVAAVAFSAPMWGIGLSPVARPLAWSVSWVGRVIGRGHRYAPGTSADRYLVSTSFDENLLTTDPEMYAYMQRQPKSHPELSLGGPSLSWLFAALREARSLRALTPPTVPALAMLGSDEEIVDPEAIRAVMRRWPGGRLDVVAGARHELMMERPEVRGRFFDAATAHFRRQTRSAAA